MAAPRFSFSSGSTGFFNPNQILVPTQLSAADKAQAEKFQAEADAYDKLVEKYKADIDAYNAAVAKFNVSADNFNKGSSAPSSTTKMVCSGFSATGRGGGNVCTPVSNVSRGSPTPGVFTSGIGQAKPSSAPAPTFNLTVPVAPTQPSFSEEEVKAFSDAAKLRAQKQQAVKQTALNLFQNPTGFSQQYGIGSLGFADGGDVPFFLEAEPTRSKVPSQEELTNALLRYFPILQLLNRTSKIVTEFYPDVVKSAVRAIKNPETSEEELKELAYRTRTNTVDPILNMFGTSSESLGLVKDEKPPVYKTKFADGGEVPQGGVAELNPYGTDPDMVIRIQRFLEKNRP